MHQYHLSYLNTSNVNVNHVKVNGLVNVYGNLNTSNVNVNQRQHWPHWQYKLYLNTSNVNVNHDS